MNLDPISNCIERLHARIPAIERFAAPDGLDDTETPRKLTLIDRWYCEQLAYLVQRLEQTPEPGGEGSPLVNTLIVCTNQLVKRNSHTLEDVPFIMVGGGRHFRMGRSVRLGNLPHNRLLRSWAYSFGHHPSQFGNPDDCGAGPLTGHL